MDPNLDVVYMYNDFIIWISQHTCYLIWSFFIWMHTRSIPDFAIVTINTFQEKVITIG